MKPLLITIDGPAGAGKTTVSRTLADRLEYRYIDTGALYRGVALAVKEKRISADDDNQLAGVLQQLSLRFERTSEGLRLLSGDRDITEMIRTPDITMLASAVSAKPAVRQALFDLQRKLGAEKSAVFEGRDMGTVVFPDADVKFFLVADIKTRAMRRYEEFKERTGQSLEDVEKDMKRRDANDSGRAVAPLKPAEDAVVIDSTDIPVEEVVAQMMRHIRMAGGHGSGLAAK